MEIDFNKYKNRLTELLNCNPGQNIRCFNPNHEDKNPSCTIYENKFKCQSCSIHGDVYDAIGIIYNITDKAEQYKKAEQLFGSGEIPEIKKKPKFEINQDALNQVIEYIRNQTNTEQGEKYLNFFTEKRGYDDNFKKYFGYYPGFEKAKQELSEDILKQAGITEKAFWYPGSVLRFHDSKGIKKFSINKAGETIKRNSKGSKTIFYKKLDSQQKQILITEAEIDNIALLMNNIQAISFSGINGVKEEYFYLFEEYEEIIICFNNDDAGKKADGRIPNIKEDGSKIIPLAEKLKIRFPDKIIKIMDLPQINNYTDPDDFIKSGKIEIILQALYNSKIFELKEDKDESSMAQFQDQNIHNNNDSICDCNINTINNTSNTCLSRDSLNYNKLLIDAILTQAEKLWSDILKIELEKHDYKVITEIVDKRNYLKYYIKYPGKIYYIEALSFQELACEILENSIYEFLKSQEENNIKNIDKIIKKLQTRSYINAVIDLFGRKSGVINQFINWNQTPECLPCLDGIIDFSTKKIEIRQPYENEYFLNPIKFNVNDIIQSREPDAFIDALQKYFPDSDTLDTSLYCLSQMIGNKAQKTFQIWTSPDGNNGKNTIVDYMSSLLNGRCTMLSSSLIKKDCDKSERKFSTHALRGISAGIFDESDSLEHLALDQIKKLTSLSYIRTESKGINSVETKQTWTLIALTNQLPKFFPPDDTAFLARLVVLPFYTVFYANDEVKQEYLKKGISEDRLKPEANKSELLQKLENNSPGVLRLLIKYYMFLKFKHNYEIPLSPECKRLKNKYIHDNDTMLQLYEDCFEIDATETYFLPNEKFKAIYLDYFGEFPRYNYLKKFVEKFKLKQTIRSHKGDDGVFKTKRGFLGLVIKTEQVQQEIIKYNDD